jgi:surface antigen
VLCGRNDRDVKSGDKQFLVERTPGRHKGRRFVTHGPRPENPRNLKERGGGRADPYSSRPGSAIRFGYDRRPDLPDLGDASQWITRARGKGFPTGSRPLPEAIAWFPPNRNGVGPYGHVAYVTAVSGNTISITDYDGERPVERHRTILWAGLRFIYRRGQSEPPLTPTPSPLATNALLSQKLADAPGTSPSAIAWDGTATWIGDAGGTIFKLDDAYRVASSFTAPPGSFAFRQGGLVFTGTNFAVVDGTDTHGTIYDFVVTGTSTGQTGSSPAPALDFRYDTYMTWDGTFLWFANGYKVYKLSPSGSELFQFSVAWPIEGIAADGSNLWLAHSGSASGTMLDEVSPAGAPVATYTTRIALMRGMAWIKGSLLALGGLVSHDIYKIDAPS